MPELTLEQQRALAIARARRAQRERLAAQSQTGSAESTSASAPEAPPQENAWPTAPLDESSVLSRLAVATSPQRLFNIAQRAGNNIPFADEVRSAYAAGEELAGNALRGRETEGGIRGAWERGRERDRGNTEFANENMSDAEKLIADTAGLSTSVIAPMVAAPAIGMTVAPAATGVGRVAQATSTGGLAGLVTGLGEGESVEDRTRNSLITGGIGAGLGGIASTGIEVGSALARRVGRAFTSSGDEASALRRIDQRLQMDDLAPEDAAREVSEMRAAGTRPSVMDVSPSTRALGRSVATEPGATQREMRQFATGRRAAISGQVREQIREPFIPPTVQGMTPDEISATARRSVNNAYGPQYAAVTDTIDLQAVGSGNRTLSALLRTDDARSAYTQAIRIADNFGDTLPQLYDDAGNLVVPNGPVPARSLHWLRESIDDMIENTSGTRTTASLQALRNQLDDILKTGSPTIRRLDGVVAPMYRAAGTASRMYNQFEALDADEFAGWLRNATPEEQVYGKIGAAFRLSHTLDDFVDPETALTMAPDRMQRFVQMFDNEADANRFLAHIRAQREIAATSNNILQGNQIPRDVASMGRESGQEVLSSVADGVASGNWFSFLRQSASQITRSLPRNVSAEERRAIVRLLTETDPQRLSAMFGDLSRIRSTDNLVNLVRSLAGRTTAAGVAVDIGTGE
jgi:hypothetical protein